jgi:hypothetical protein
VRSVLVLDTYYVPGPLPGDERGAHYQIIVAPDGTREAPRVVMLTRDRELYARALAAEGRADRRFDCRWRVTRRADGTYCRWLDELREVA